MSEKIIKKKIYFENLDAIRFLCFLSVFFFHSFHTEDKEILGSPIYQFIQNNIFQNGNLGVNFFFVLSGFLITYLLIEEKRLNKQIHIRRFWIRRALRIWPLFYFCVFFGFFIFPYIKTLFGEVPNESANLIYYLTFLNNFDFINNGLPDASILGVLWSIAIEEQFYFFWPLLIFLIPIKKYWIAFLIILSISLITRYFNNNYYFFEYHTLSCISDMVIGALGAWLILTNNKFKNKVIDFNSSIIITIYVVFGFIYFFRDNILSSNDFIRVIERPVIAIVILLIILEQSFSNNSFFKFSRLKRISELGKITYGLYSLHFIGILITIKAFKLFSIDLGLLQVLIIEPIVALFLTIIISKISYNILETPFLKLKDKFSYFTK